MGARGVKKSHSVTDVLVSYRLLPIRFRIQNVFADGSSQQSDIYEKGRVL
jgi:hypothetical protein